MNWGFEPGWAEARTVGGGFEVVAVLSQICLASPEDAKSGILSPPKPLTHPRNQWGNLNVKAGKVFAA